MPPWDHGVEFGGSATVAQVIGAANALYAESVKGCWGFLLRAYEGACLDGILVASVLLPLAARFAALLLE